MECQPPANRSRPVGERMRARTALYVTIAMIALAGVRAHAVTLEDVVELAQSGIGDVVLIELIEMDDVAYPLTPFRLRGSRLPASPTKCCWRCSAVAGRRTSRSDGCPTRMAAACEPVVTRVVPVPVLVPARPARRTGGRERAPGPLTVLGFGGVGGFSPLSTVTTETTGTATSTRREPSYWGCGGKKRPAPGTDTATRASNIPSLLDTRSSAS